MAEVSVRIMCRRYRHWFYYGRFSDRKYTRIYLDAREKGTCGGLSTRRDRESLWKLNVKALEEAQKEAEVLDGEGKKFICWSLLLEQFSLETLKRFLTDLKVEIH